MWGDNISTWDDMADQILAVILETLTRAGIDVSRIQFYGFLS
jgi:alpha-glucosidase (family GH31 glycosyl hydrolase)